jgi:hypothetical protein
MEQKDAISPQSKEREVHHKWIDDSADPKNTPRGGKEI